ncbi:MAG TPA: 6-pyruvoyl-tetrahydropterin synthase-related protein, partial [Candidatus Woesebacteria bacterium]|nr:6-pyruvoyl-tetrahydropterin synthase-related protein [Candidatus Woesebacteria bacterium]
PIFNFYAPLPYYVSAGLGLLGLDALWATKAAFIFATLLAGISMYVLVKEFFGKLPALTAAVVYVYFPYHAINIYIRGNLNEVFAYAFFPLIFLGFYKLYYFRKGQIMQAAKWVGIMGMSIAWLVTSHNLSAYMVALIFTLLTLLGVVFAQERVKFITLIGIAGLLGIGLSAFYWIPVLFEMKYSDVLSQVGGGADFRDHFVCISQYWNSPWGFGGSGPGCIDGMSFKLGKTNILFSALSIVLFIFLLSTKKIKEHTFLFFSILGVLVFSIFISTEYSAFLWEMIPRIDFLQFPWRFINFVATAMSILIGILIVGVDRIGGKIASGTIAVGIIVVTLILNAKLFVPQSFYDRTSEYYTDQNFIRWETSKISDEYMPPNFLVPQSESEVPREKIVISSGRAEIKNTLIKTGKIRAIIEAETQSTVLLAIAPFPAWEILRNGADVEYRNTNRGIQIQISEGESEIQATFVQTPVERLGNGITVITFISMIGFYSWSRKYGKKAKKK